MLIFKLDRIKRLVNPTYLMHRLHERAIFKCTPSKFSIIIREVFSGCVMALQIMPQFFTRYVCDQFHWCSFFTNDFYFTVRNMAANDSISLTFSLAEYQNHVTLEFTDILDRAIAVVVVSTAPSYDVNVGQIDYSCFVSFDLKEFRRIIWNLNGARALVTLTDSELVFSIPNKSIILTKERRQCIIGGVVAGEAIQFVMAIEPMEFFFNFTSERIWLFKSIEFSNRIILAAPVGLHAEISSLFPEYF